MPFELNTTDANFISEFEKLKNSRNEVSSDIEDTVRQIILDVQTHGDSALISLTKKFDGIDLKEIGFRITPDEIHKASRRLDRSAMQALELAARRIKSFHRRQIPEDISYMDDEGVTLGMTWKPLDSVGLYVPGGRASYPSSVLMTAIPALVAGVERRVLMVPTPNYKINPLVLAAAQLAGVTEIYRIGGAQAIAALAYGTDSILPVHKIVGPGNAYVAAAKRAVFGKVGIDSIAGPSEILVVADKHNDPSWIAIDLLSQAEHDVLAQAILITDDSSFATKVLICIDEALRRLKRSEIASKSWQKYGAVIIVENLEEIPNLVNQLAPEHLELAVVDPESLAENIRHAGAIFLGRFTPEAIGDYIAGPNHVLPTGRSARFSSGLSVFDFFKRNTWIKCDSKSLARIGPAAVTLAKKEGLDTHGESILIRLNSTIKK